MIQALMLLAAGAASTAPRIGDLPISRDRIDRAAPRAPVPVQPVRIPAKVISVGSDTPIKGIRFRGAKAPAPVAAAAGRFLGKPATAKTLGELAAALSTAYGSSAVALYTVAIPEQDFAGGIVTVSLTEGSIARVEIQGDPKRHPQLRRRLAPLTQQKPLSRATFERQLTLAQAIPGLTMTPQFTDPNFDGALVMGVAVKQKRHKLTGGFSSRGIDLLGGGQFDAALELYGTAIDGDQFTLTGSAARDFKRYRFASAGYSAPIGGDGLTAGLSAAYFETRPKFIPIRGKARQAAASLSYPLIHSFKRSADVSLSFEGLNSDNAAFGNIIASERTRVVRGAASFSVTLPNRSASVLVSLSKGFDGLGARAAAPYIQPDFLKATAAASVAQAIGKRAALRGSLTAQYTRDNLPAAERMTLGGETIGRAFDTGVLSGDRGVGALAEFAYQPLKIERLKTSEIYTFIDEGRLTVLGAPGLADQSYSLGSAGAGFRARYREKYELGLEGSRVIDRPTPGYAEKWRLTVSWRITT
ncbi:ShlB/FhaC/HecB family hemolysin secretion/activation protein [Sphingomonas antarctica]|uniref:ShlB/FhaC/HecB family hemolysin secretion/activation protein n=1 Tax=Sphingomonas antarctica TaxID=2040274 RepID=UPI0039E75C3F